MISTHILDTSLGLPAAEVTVRLELNVDGKWDLISVEETNADGRISFKGAAKPGIYRLQFLTESYFKKSNTKSFFGTIPVVFQIEDTQRKYHIPLLLNPFGYSTYRGS